MGLDDVGDRDAAAVDRRVDSVFAELDYNRDGKIEYYEFLKYWREFNDHHHKQPPSDKKSKLAKLMRKVVNGLGVFGVWGNKAAEASAMK